MGGGSALDDTHQKPGIVVGLQTTVGLVSYYNSICGLTLMLMLMWVCWSTASYSPETTTVNNDP